MSKTTVVRLLTKALSSILNTRVAAERCFETSCQNCSELVNSKDFLFHLTFWLDQEETYLGGFAEMSFVKANLVNLGEN